MKYISLIYLVISTIGVTAQEKEFVVTGSIPATTKKYKVLLSWNNGATGEEANVVNGKFKIKGSVDEPVAATLMLQEANPAAGKKFNRLEAEQNTLYLFLDGGTISLTTQTHLWDADVRGTAIVNEYQEYQEQIRKLFRLESKMGEVYDAYRTAKNNIAADEVFKLYEQMLHLYYKEQLTFVTNHPKSLVSLYLSKQALGNTMDAAKAAPLYQMLSTELKNSTNGKELGAMIAIATKSMIGVAATDFTQPSPEGINISLSSFKGKYVLVDFWASWCGPCRAESPNLVHAYNQYKSKGFEIFSVSMDEKKEKWLKAIKDDGYTWAQAGDLKGWENEAGAIYGISSIPFNFLIDPNGVIIARNLRGEALETRLHELFK